MGRVDRLLLVDTYHHLNSNAPRSDMKRWRHRLRADGLVVIVEWRPGELGAGADGVNSSRSEQVIEELRAAGYRLVERTPLRYHDVIVFRPGFGAHSSGRGEARLWAAPLAVAAPSTVLACRARTGRKDASCAGCSSAVGLRWLSSSPS